MQRKDTALHRAVRNCPDYAEYEAEAARLRIRKDPIGKDYLVIPWPREGYPKVQKSGLKSLCKTEYQRFKLKQEILDWNHERFNAMKCIGYLCLAEADPRLYNAEGQTPLDIARTKHPEIQMQLQKQLEWMTERDEYEIMVANDPDPEAYIPPCPDRDEETGIFYICKDQTFMARLDSKTRSPELKGLKGDAGPAIDLGSAIVAVQKELDAQGALGSLAPNERAKATKAPGHQTSFASKAGQARF